MHHAAGRSIAALLILAAWATTSTAQAQTPNLVEVQFQGMFDSNGPLNLFANHQTYSGTIVYDANAQPKYNDGTQSIYDVVSFTVVIAGTSIELTTVASTSGLSITDSGSPTTNDEISFVSDVQDFDVLVDGFPLELSQFELKSSGPSTAFSGAGPGNVAAAYNANLNDQSFEYRFQIDTLSRSVRDDDDIGSAGTDVTFIGSNTNQAPVANAGPDQSGRPGDTITLDGNASTDDATPPESLVYAWQLVIAPDFSTATLSDPSSPTPSFVIDLPGTYVAELVVTDGDGVSSTADDVIVGTDNLAPTADAGPDQTVEIGNIVNLNGSGSSDPENDAMSFEWTLATRPSGSAAELVGADTATPTLTPDVPGEYGVSLTTSDFIGPGAPDSMAITATGATNTSSSTSTMIAQLAAASDLIAGLPTDAFRRGNFRGGFIGEAYRRSALWTLRIATSRLARYERTENRRLLVAANFLVQSLLRRADGCARTGAPDRRGRGRDTIVDCTAQAELNAILQPVAAALQALLAQE